MRKTVDSKFRKSISTAGSIVAAAVMIGGSGHGQTVGRRTEGQIFLPVNQILTPLGTQIDLPGQRPQALALSPNGRRLAVAGKSAGSSYSIQRRARFCNGSSFPPNPSKNSNRKRLRPTSSSPTIRVN